MTDVQLKIKPLTLEGAAAVIANGIEQNKDLQSEITRLKTEKAALIEAVELLLTNFPEENLYPNQTHGTTLFEWKDLERARAAIARATIPNPAKESAEP